MRSVVQALIDSGDAAGLLYSVMPFVDGESTYYLGINRNKVTDLFNGQPFKTRAQGVPVAVDGVSICAIDVARAEAAFVGVLARLFTRHGNRIGALFVPVPELLTLTLAMRPLKVRPG